jgi:hypothetical protein
VHHATCIPWHSMSIEFMQKQFNYTHFKEIWRFKLHLGCSNSSKFDFSKICHFASQKKHLFWLAKFQICPKFCLFPPSFVHSTHLDENNFCLTRNSCWRVIESLRDEKILAILDIVYVALTQTNKESPIYSEIFTIMSEIIDKIPLCLGFSVILMKEYSNFPILWS